MNFDGLQAWEYNIIERHEGCNIRGSRKWMLCDWVVTWNCVLCSDAELWKILMRNRSRPRMDVWGNTRGHRKRSYCGWVNGWEWKQLSVGQLVGWQGKGGGGGCCGHLYSWLWMGWGEQSVILPVSQMQKMPSDYELFQWKRQNAKWRRKNWLEFEATACPRRWEFSSMNGSSALIWICWVRSRIWLCTFIAPASWGN